LRDSPFLVRSPSEAITNGMSFCTCALIPSSMSCAAFTSPLRAVSNAILQASGTSCPRLFRLTDSKYTFANRATSR
jgi:hypothetical protein